MVGKGRIELPYQTYQVCALTIELRAHQRAYKARIILLYGFILLEIERNGLAFASCSHRFLVAGALRNHAVFENALRQR